MSWSIRIVAHFTFVIVSIACVFDHDSELSPSQYLSPTLSQWCSHLTCSVLGVRPTYIYRWWEENSPEQYEANMFWCSRYDVFCSFDLWCYFQWVSSLPRVFRILSSQRRRHRERERGRERDESTNTNGKAQFHSINDDNKLSLFISLSLTLFLSVIAFLSRCFAVFRVSCLYLSNTFFLFCLNGRKFWILCCRWCFFFFAVLVLHGLTSRCGADCCNVYWSMDGVFICTAGMESNVTYVCQFMCVYRL